MAARHLPGKKPYLFWTVLQMPCTRILSIFIPIQGRIQPIWKWRPGNTKPKTSDGCGPGTAFKFQKTLALRFTSAGSWKANHARNLPHLLAVTLSTSDPVTFEIFGNFYLYMEEYHKTWMERWQGTPGDIACTAKYGEKKKIRWTRIFQAQRCGNIFNNVPTI